MCYSRQCIFQTYQGDCNFPKNDFYNQPICPSDFNNPDDYFDEVIKFQKLIKRQETIKHILKNINND